MSGLGITFPEPWLSPIRHTNTEATSQDPSPCSKKDLSDSESCVSTRYIPRQNSAKEQLKENDEENSDVKKEEKALVLLDKLLNSMVDSKKLSLSDYSEQNALIICSILERVKEVLDSSSLESHREDQKNSGTEFRQAIKAQIDRLMRLMQKNCISFSHPKKPEQGLDEQRTEQNKSLTDYLPPSSPTGENQNYNKVIFVEKSEAYKPSTPSLSSNSPLVSTPLSESGQKARMSSLQSVKQHLQPETLKNEEFQPFRTQQFFSEHSGSRKEAHYSLEGLYFRTYNSRNENAVRSVTPHPTARSGTEEVQYSTPNSKQRRDNYNSCPGSKNRVRSTPAYSQRALLKSASKTEAVCKRTPFQKNPKPTRDVVVGSYESQQKRKVISTIEISKQQGLSKGSYIEQNKIVVSSPLQTVSNGNYGVITQSHSKRLLESQQIQERSYTEISENSANTTNEFCMAPKYPTVEKPKRYAEICSNKNGLRSTPKKPGQVHKYSEIHKSCR